MRKQPVADTGYYTALGSGALDAFAADVTTALDNFRAASRRSGLEVAMRLAEDRAPEVADLALGTLRSLVDDHKAQRAQQAKAKPAHKVAQPCLEVSWHVWSVRHPPAHFAD